MKKTIFVILSFLLFLSCKEGSLSGKWERTGDAEAGTVIKIEKDHDSYRGTLVSIKGKLQYRGFSPGEIMWKEIKKTGDSRYRGIMYYISPKSPKAGKTDDNESIIKIHFTDNVLDVTEHDTETGRRLGVSRWKGIQK